MTAVTAACCRSLACSTGRALFSAYTDVTPSLSITLIKSTSRSIHRQLSIPATSHSRLLHPIEFPSSVYLDPFTRSRSQLSAPSVIHASAPGRHTACTGSTVSRILPRTTQLGTDFISAGLKEPLGTATGLSGELLAAFHQCEVILLGHHPTPSFPTPGYAPASS